MRFSFSTLRKTSTKAVVLLLVLSFVAPAFLQPLLPMPIVQVAEAQNVGGAVAGGIAACVAGIIVAGFMSLAAAVFGALAVPTFSTGSENGSLFKDCVLDAIVWELINFVLEEILADLTDWINNGFEGAPVFMTDLDGFLLDIGDRIAGDFIVGSGLSFLCEPFQLDIQINLLLRYYSSWGSEGTYCRLTDVVANIEGFLNGDFFDGGWMGWMQMSMYPSGNPTGSFLNAAAELDFRIGAKTWEENNLLARAANWLSLRDENGNVDTPGIMINDQANSWIDSGRQRLTLADELDELLGALFAYFVRDVFGSEGGFRGASGGYTDRIRDGQRQACLARQEGLVTEITTVIASEQAGGFTQFIAQLQELLARAQAVTCAIPGSDLVILNQIAAELAAIKSQIATRGTGAQCSDNLDNDGDGPIDFPADPDCTSATDTSEGDDVPPPLAQCSDSIDNDGDGPIDFPADPDCTSATDPDESAGGGTPPPPPPLAQCADGLDNDGDNSTDFPSDLGCASASDNDENDSAAPPSQCTDNTDNDGDGLIDYPADPGCTSAPDNDETDSGPPEPPPIS